MAESETPSDQQYVDSKPSERRTRRRVNTVLVLSIVVLLLMLSLIAQGGFNLSPIFSPDTAGETLLLYALSTLNFLAFITVLFILLRNVLKLVRERRSGRLGSKFKMRLVSYAIGLSLLPALLLFFFAFGLLNRSIDRWFGEPARQVVDGAKALEEGYFRKEEADLAAIAGKLARPIAALDKGPGNEVDLGNLLREGLRDYNLSVVRMVTARGRTTFPQSDDTLEPMSAPLSLAEQALLSSGEPYASHTAGSTPGEIFVIAGVPVPDAGYLILARRFPSELTKLTTTIDEQHRNFHSLLGKNRRIKQVYTLLLAAVTLLLIFASSWLALHVARGITVPIAALAEATDRVARDDFSHRVDVVADDELASLVNSFNQMAGRLAENRERLERAAEDLRRTNLALDDRRRYIETVLESLSTGVISTDENSRVTTINRAALSMLGLDRKPEVGTPLNLLVGQPEGAEVATLCRRARRAYIAQSDVEFRRPDGSSVHTATTAIALARSDGEIEGWVIVVEDLTDLIQAERAAAWGEVARRMAHEIKNPLTPIQLSAERILRNYERGVQPDAYERFDQILREGTSTIVREVSALQRMVEEFSRFARLPEARPVDSSLNQTVRDAVGLYTERLNGIRLECDLAENVPVLHIDPDQFKRVLVNLIDNAVEALAPDAPSGNGDTKARVIRIETSYDEEAERVRLIVSDTGHGIRPADRDKLFLPKFSTRSRATGLGLAIVAHIVADHRGRIWVEENNPRGARFIIEIPG